MKTTINYYYIYQLFIQINCFEKLLTKKLRITGTLNFE